jgi:hypothetical protein
MNRRIEDGKSLSERESDEGHQDSAPLFLEINPNLSFFRSPLLPKVFSLKGIPFSDFFLFGLNLFLDSRGFPKTKLHLLLTLLFLLRKEVIC